MLTQYHTKLYAEFLSLQRPTGNVERLASTLLGARLDLNPHQVDAALFAFRSPLSKGALLADEVGLGKTIEAGIVLAQKWAEQKRHILIVAPASLRTQWQRELLEKFALPSVIVDKNYFEQCFAQGMRNPFNASHILVVSYDYARRKADLLSQVAWDVVVMDEAHRLRNVHKKGATVAKELRRALNHAPKLLLTATPLQNSLEELYGLVSFIDEHIFCDIKTFRAQFSKPTKAALADLKVRLAPICKRTLRRQVTEYIRYTERRAYTQDFTLSADEEELYTRVSAFLQRDNLWSLPSNNRALIILVLRKLLASSSFAIAGALQTMRDRLEFILHHYRDHKEGERPTAQAFETLTKDYESCALEESDALLYGTRGVTIPTEEEEKSIRDEILQLNYMISAASHITNNAKGTALLQALRTGFSMAKEYGGAQKAIIFTESRKTQAYLFRLLSENGYAKKIVLFNGSNKDAHSTAIYREWKEKYAGSDRISGSRDVDMRTALVEAFKDSASIMIATEAASEGINLQFCSLVINYDLPWNPQRIEQRIGRCHRYGQKHDVVVVNFLNRSNAADRRVLELLSEKFQLFNGIFGASDEVLGSIESGVDFEKRIVEIYQTCRSPEEIQASFDSLQSSLSQEIDASLHGTRQKLLENFDAEVAQKLHVYKAETRAALDAHGAMFWELTRHVLHDYASFDSSNLCFTLHKSPVREVPVGTYLLPQSIQSPYAAKGHLYRMGSPLSQWVLQQALHQNLPTATLYFGLSASSKKIAALEPFKGQGGLMRIAKVRIKALSTEEHLVFLAMTDRREVLSPETTRKLFELPASVAPADINTAPLCALYEERKKNLLGDISMRNNEYFEEEMTKLDRWADERKNLLEMNIKELDKAIREAKSEARKISDLRSKVDKQRHIKILEGKRNDMRKRLFEAQDKVEEDKDTLLNDIESALGQNVQEEDVLCIRWELV